jgi:hypothetical protein
MKNVKMLFTAIAVIAIAGGAIAAKHKSDLTYYSCSSSSNTCVTSHPISGANDFVLTQDVAHPNQVNDATTPDHFGTSCVPATGCGTLFYGTGQ